MTFVKVVKITVLLMEKNEGRRWQRSRARQSHSWVVTAGLRLLPALDHSMGYQLLKVGTPLPLQPQREVGWPWGEA